MHAVVASDTGLAPNAASAMSSRSMRRTIRARCSSPTRRSTSIRPDEKRDIVQNAIDLAHALGIAGRGGHPSAVETVNPAIRRRSTPPRCARWPSAARSPAACSTDRWRSTTRSGRGGPQQGHRLAGRRARGHPGRARYGSRQHAGQAADLSRRRRNGRHRIGARVPIMLTSRADGVTARLGSCALAVMLRRGR